jgi:hypothetical protein
VPDSKDTKMKRHFRTLQRIYNFLRHQLAIFAKLFNPLSFNFLLYKIRLIMTNARVLVKVR